MTGSKVRIAAHMVVLRANHSYINPDAPIMCQLETRIGIGTGSDVWIGWHAVILDAVQIGKGAVSAAEALINRDA